MGVSENKLARAKEVQAKYESQLLEKPNVVGVSIGQRDDNADEAAIVVLVDDLAAQNSDDRIPSELDGVPVTVRQIGKLEAVYQAKREASWV